MRWATFAFGVVLAASLSLPGAAAPPDGAAAGDEAITFAQYREWRLNFAERRRSEIAVQLSGADLPAPRKTRLEETRAYYEWLAALSDAERDRRFRERFDRIDANRDGKIDPDERAAWRDKRRAFYQRGKPASEPREAAAAR